jgi:hypothetical protein
MKRTIQFLNMAALVFVGSITLGCSSDDENSSLNPTTGEESHPETSIRVTLTTTISRGGTSEARRRVLSEQGVKTFAVGDQIAVVYTNTSSERVKAVSNALAAADITNSGKSAKITVTLTNPVAGTVDYVYPAAMANGDGTLNYSALCTQDGTLASLASNLDCAKGSGEMTGSGSDFTLPTGVSLANQLAVCEFKVMEYDEGTNITSSITDLILSDGTNVYSVSREAAAGPIYVAMKPVTSDKTLTFVAIDNTGNRYRRGELHKTLEANDMIPVNLKMYNTPEDIDLSTLSEDCVVQNGEMLTGQLATSHQISIAPDAIVILKDVDINYGTDLSGSYAGITCQGNATLIIKGTDYVKGLNAGYPGIFVPASRTLTVTGDGTLFALGHDYGAGIGSGRSDIDAVKTCGNIIIEGGTIWGTGGTGAAGIGSGAGTDENPSTCGTITIKRTVTHVYATAGSGAQAIGSGDHSTCGTVTAEDPSKITQK